MAAQKIKNIQSLNIEKKISIFNGVGIYFHNLKEKLFSLGISSDLFNNEIKRIILLNKITLVSLFCTYSLGVFFNFLSLDSTSYFLYALSFLFFLVLALNYFQRFTQARVVYLLAINLVIFCLSTTFSRDSGILFFYIPTILVTSLLFEETEKNLQFTGIFISIVCVIFLEATDYSLIKIDGITPNLLHFLNIYSLITISILSFYLITLIVEQRGSSYSMIRENEKLQKYLVREVLNRQNAFESLDFSVKMQNELMDNIQSGIIIINANGDIIKTNKLFEEMFRINFLRHSNNIFTLLPDIYKNCEKYIQEIKENIELVKSGNTNYRELEFTREARFSKEFYSLKISRIGIDSSSFHGIFLMHNNISELKKNKERSEFFRNFRLSLKNKLPDIMLNLNADGKILDFYSEPTSSMYFSPEAMVGRNLIDFGLPDEFILEFNQTLKQVINSGNSHKIQYNFNFDSIDYSYSATLLLSDTKEVMIFVKKLEEKASDLIT